MRRPLAFVLTFCLAAPVPVFAADPPNAVGAARVSSPIDQRSAGQGPVLAAANRESTRLALSLARTPDPPSNGNRSWISRHPALFGTLVGAGAGAVMSVTMDNELFCSGGDEDCFFHGGSRVLVGAGMGAGIGALVGWIAGR